MTKQVAVSFSGEDLKKWNAVSNYYANKKAWISRAEVLRILVEQEYDRLFIEKTA